MNHITAISALIATVMLVFIVMTPVSVLADKTAASSETQVTEIAGETVKAETKETENTAPKEEESKATVPSAVQSDIEY